MVLWILLNFFTIIFSRVEADQIAEPYRIKGYKIDLYSDSKIHQSGPQ